MLRKSNEIPYSSKLVTILWKEKGEWHFCNSKTEKRDLCERIDAIDEVMVIWTGKWSSDVFEIDWKELEKV